MFEVFEKYLRSKTEITDEELEMIRAVSIQRKLRKRQYLLQEGDVSRHDCFIAKGCLRTYRVSEDGNEHILRFAVENWWMSDKESYNSGKPTKINIDALEDSELIIFTKENFTELQAAIPNLRLFMEQLHARAFDVIQNRLYTHISYTAEEKYNNFIKSYPDIFNRVPLHMIASYLGVSRETLSRIRSQYAHR
jgi:CRP-like cAMP-binding protein